LCSYPLLDAAHDDDAGKASIFSDYFLSAIPTTPPAADIMEVVRVISRLKYFNCVPFTADECSLAVKALKNTAPGHD
jgi:hypothetical protein